MIRIQNAGIVFRCQLSRELTESLRRILSLYPPHFVLHIAQSRLNSVLGKNSDPRMMTQRTVFRDERNSNRVGDYEEPGSIEYMGIAQESGYLYWAQVAGYFDGDGAIILVPRRYNLAFHLTWTDTYLPQLEQLKTFLESQALTPTKTYGGESAYFFALNVRRDVLAAAREMIPLTYKKRDDLETVVQYLENRITGTKAIENLNESVRAKMRSARIRSVNMPFTLLEGTRMGIFLGKQQSAKTQSKLNDEEKEVIRSDRKSGITVRELANRYGVSKDTIYRVLKSDM